MATGLILTAVGAAAIETAYQAGKTVSIPTVAFGDGGGHAVTADPAVTRLVNKFGSVPLSAADKDATLRLIGGIAVINCKDFPGKTIREFGLMSDTGVLIGYCATPDTYLPEQSDSILKEVVVDFIMTLTHAESVTLIVDPLAVMTQKTSDARYLQKNNNLSDVTDAAVARRNLGIPTQQESDARFLLKIGDTATGKIGAPYFQANGNSGNGWPEGAGEYLDQLNTRAPFFQPNFDWEGQAGSATYVPLTKGRATRKGKGWPTAVSFGYLLPKEDKSAQPVIHVISDVVENTWVFDPDTGRIYSKAGTVALQSETTPAGVPMPWPTNVAPPGHALMVGQSFNKVTYPQLAAVYPTGVFPDLRGRTILGKPDDRQPLVTAEGEVKYHGHTGEVGGTDLGAPQTTPGGSHRHRAGMNAPGDVWSTMITGTDNDGRYNLGYTDWDGDHVHSISLGWHGHSLRIDAYGATKNTVDNIAFNYIVRLA